MAKIDPHSAEARDAVEYRQSLYRRVRDNLDGGAVALPGDLKVEDVRVLTSAARARQDHQIIALCRDWY